MKTVSGNVILLTRNFFHTFHIIDIFCSFPLQYQSQRDIDFVIGLVIELKVTVSELGDIELVIDIVNELVIASG